MQGLSRLSLLERLERQLQAGVPQQVHSGVCCILRGREGPMLYVHMCTHLCAHTPTPAHHTLRQHQKEAVGSDSWREDHQGAELLRLGWNRMPAGLLAALSPPDLAPGHSLTPYSASQPRSTPGQAFLEYVI